MANEKLPSPKDNSNGQLYFGNKDAAYLEKISREAVESHHDAPILYFEIDWINSKRNFYGEMTQKKLINAKGVEVRGTYKLTQSEESAFQGIPNKLMTLVVSVYVEQMKELSISPKLGDYFLIGKRVYEIYDKTIEDTGPGQLIMNRKRMRQDFMCLQQDDEAFQSDFFGDNLGSEIDLKKGNSDVE